MDPFLHTKWAPSKTSSRELRCLFKKPPRRSKGKEKKTATHLFGGPFLYHKDFLSLHIFYRAYINIYIYMGSG